MVQVKRESNPMPIDYEEEVIRHPLFKHAIIGTLATFTFTAKYPKGQVERLVVSRDVLGSYTAIIWIKYKGPTEIRFDHHWDLVEGKIRRLLQEYDCRPFRIGSP
jgi:hypothetical protein